MKRISLILVLFFCNLLLSQKVALVGGTLIDGYGNTPIYDSVILINGETITDIGTIGNIDIPSEYEVVSTEGMSVMPGLWDMHVHLMINGHSDYAYWDKTYPKSLDTSLSMLIILLSINAGSPVASIGLNENVVFVSCSIIFVFSIILL